ncbi:MAG: hypothetical protein ACJ75Z_03175 [Solirubrobacterales bacterium]
MRFRRTGLRQLFLACALTGVCLAAAASSAGAVGRDFYGVVAVQPPNTAEFNAMGRGKVGTLRVLFYWPTVEPTRGSRNWGLYDQIVANAALQGVRVMPTLFGSPSFAARNLTQYPISRASRQAFAQFVTDAVNRYKASGTFWQSSYWQSFAAAHPGARQLPITDWQLWNEVNSPSYSTPHPHPRQYAALLKLTGAIIHSADPGGHLILAGMFTRPSQPRAIPLEEYLNDLYRIKGTKRAFDALAVHPYAHKAAEALRTVRGVRKLTRKRHDGSSPIWLTELGWASSGRPSRYTTSPDGQAARLQASFSSLTANAARFGIAGILWYSLVDASTDSYWLNRTGLFELNGTPKPAWAAFVGFTGGQP